MSLDSGEPWIAERFSIDPRTVMVGGPGLTRVVSAIRSDMIPTVEAVASALSDHLELRIDELCELLDYIVETTNIADRDDAFRVSQYRRNAAAGTVGLTQYDYEHYTAAHNLEDVASIRREVSSIRMAGDRLEAFEVFSLIEERFDPLESDVFDFVRAVDDMVNDEIDRLCGN